MTLQLCLGIGVVSDGVGGHRAVFHNVERPRGSTFSHRFIAIVLKIRILEFSARRHFHLTSNNLSVRQNAPHTQIIHAKVSALVGVSVQEASDISTSSMTSGLLPIVQEASGSSTSDLTLALLATVQEASSHSNFRLDVE
jgi:hypothetical protein